MLALESGFWEVSLGSFGTTFGAPHPLEVGGRSPPNLTGTFTFEFTNDFQIC